MEITNVNPSAVRKYLYEYVLIALTACVVFLFLSFNSLNQFIRNELMNQRNELIKTVETNTNTLKEFINYQKRNNEFNLQSHSGNRNSNRNDLKIVSFKEKLFPDTQYFESLACYKFGLEPGIEISK